MEPEARKDAGSAVGLHIVLILHILFFSLYASLAYLLPNSSFPLRLFHFPWAATSSRPTVGRGKAYYFQSCMVIHAACGLIIVPSSNLLPILIWLKQSCCEIGTLPLDSLAQRPGRWGTSEPCRSEAPIFMCCWRKKIAFAAVCPLGFGFGSTKVRG